MRRRWKERLGDKFLGKEVGRELEDGKKRLRFIKCYYTEYGFPQSIGSLYKRKDCHRLSILFDIIGSCHFIVRCWSYSTNSEALTFGRMSAEDFDGFSAAFTTVQLVRKYAVAFNKGIFF